MSTELEALQVIAWILAFHCAAYIVDRVSFWLHVDKQ